MSRAAELCEALGIQRGAVVALCGAVRQASAYELAALLAETGLRVVVSATVPVALPPATTMPRTLCGDAALSGPEPAAALQEHGRVAAFGAADRPDRVRGLGAEALERLRARPEVDVLVVIADGSRHRPVKAPADHEPALPAGATHVLPMAGLDALGQALDDDHAHRPELLAALLGVAAGHRLTADDLALLLCSPLGGRKGAPAGAAFWPLLYGRTPATAAAGDVLAQMLLRDDGVAGLLVQTKGRRGCGVLRRERPVAEVRPLGAPGAPPRC